MFCLLYYLPCALYWGWYGKELTAVLLVGVCSAAALLAVMCRGMIPVLWVIFAIFLLGLCVFLYVEGKIFREMRSAGTVIPDWLLVPGYKPRKGTVPAVLHARVHKAAQLLQINPESRAILSGGFTDGPVSEAEIMERLLTERGVDLQRLVREDRSTTTEENMRFCRNLSGGAVIGLVTNGFHLYRACAEARKAGFSSVVGIAAGNGPCGLLPYHMAREFMTIVNDKIQGYM